MPAVDEKVKQQRLVIDQAKTKSAKFLVFAPNLFINILMVIALMFISMIDKNNKFTWESVWSWAFLFTTIILVIIYQITHWSAFDSRLKKLTLNEENITWFEEQEKEIINIINTVEWQNYRTYFVKDRNDEQKVLAWKINIQNKITALTTKTKKKNTDLENEVVSDYQRANLTPDSVLAIEKDIHNRQDGNRYIRRKRALEEMITDAWIAEHISKISIDYNEIDINFIETGDMMKGQSKDKTVKTGKYAKDNAPSRFITTLITVVVSVFTADLIINWSLGGWVDFVLRLMFLTVNIVMGSNYGNVFFTDTDIHNTKSRKKIAGEFVVWCAKKQVKQGI
ncbi:MAG: hypothetical protein WC143_08635 [Eubacteriales bacterium]|jgi:hypothetical protein|nr:hypothetical protein [Clostridia bacterium]MDD3086219.1 hypothetical protein [Candidatus ainarchaeum sp.]